MVVCDLKGHTNPADSNVDPHFFCSDTDQDSGSVLIQLVVSIYSKICMAFKMFSKRGSSLWVPSLGSIQMSIFLSLVPRVRCIIFTSQFC